jgi:polysaccharide export outer membrane protein
LLVISSGCRSAQYKAAQLPNEYRASAKHPDSATLNLSRLAASGIGNTKVAPGDLLEILVASGRSGEEMEPQLARVGNDGNVEVPLIGVVSVSNLEPFEASQNIARAAVERGIYVRPHVTVEVKRKAVNHITVLGAVEKPGTYEVARGACDLAAAIGAAGGLTEKASMQVDVLRQGPTFFAAAPSPSEGATGSATQLASYQSGQTNEARSVVDARTTRIDLAALPDRDVGPGLGGSSQLNDRDVVMVLPRDKEVVHVTGLVKEPGQFDLPHDQDVHLLDVVAMAGGMSSPVADKVLIIRRLPDREPLAIRASLVRAKRDGDENLRIAAGDTVSIERTPTTVVVDTLSQLFRISVGMTGRTGVF